VVTLVTGEWQPAFSEPGPSKREVAEAIASITGQPLPPELPTMNGPLAAFLGGWLAMAVEQARKRKEIPLKITQVEIPTDLDGNYLDHFIVHMASGAEVTVTLTQKGGDA
jgi:hypothetical protein